MTKPELGKNADLHGARAFNEYSEWNMRVDFAPLVKNSDQIIKAIAPKTGLHADFGSGLWDGHPIGIPYIVVPANQPLTDFVETLWPNEGDDGPFPIPDNAPIEGGGDRHVIVVQLDNSKPNGLGKLYEIYNASFDGHRWSGQAAVFDLQGGDHQRPYGWTSADAAGLPIFPGLARYDEVADAVADNATLGHALRFTLTQALTAMKAVGAASHWADDINGPAPFGMHVRLRGDFHIPADASPETRVIINTLKQYGMILADNGSDWYISGTPDKHWDNEALHVLSEVKGGDFEVVDNSKIGVVFLGGNTSDVIDGNARHNRMLGNGGSDKLSAEGGRDAVFGGDGNDVLAGGWGHDRLTGGAGRDTFVFDTKALASGSDAVLDFGDGNDRIELSRKAFDGIGSPGRLEASAFHRGEAAADAGDRIIYDPNTGLLSYDRDGSGAHAARTIATFGDHADIVAGNIWLV